MSQGFIKETPCRNVILPKERATEEEKRMYLAFEEIPRFISLFQGYSSFNSIILTLLYTGMRSGECLGLQWSDPKDPKITRYQYMNDTLIELLKKHKIEKRSCKWL